jgi:RNA polymerase sigma-70 factor (ECF subfamily)
MMLSSRSGAAEAAGHWGYSTLARERLRCCSMAERDADDRLGDLMRAAQGGDADAYRQLLELITLRVRRIVHARRGFAGPEAVEDLVQDVLLSVHAVRATYDPSRAFEPWLQAIVRHRLADQARKYYRHAHEIAAGDVGVTFDEIAAKITPEASADVDALGAAIQALPPGQRQAIELLKLRELSLKEAAAETGSTVGALKLATHRAMAALRRALRKKAE